MGKLASTPLCPDSVCIVKKSAKSVESFCRLGEPQIQRNKIYHYYYSLLPK